MKEGDRMANTSGMMAGLIRDNFSVGRFHRHSTTRRLNATVLDASQPLEQTSHETDMNRVELRTMFSQATVHTIDCPRRHPGLVPHKVVYGWDI